MATRIKNEDLKIVKKDVRPDTKRRVLLPKALVGEDTLYHICTNSSGQIILDPQVTIPASEAWLFKNPDTIATVRRGLAEAAQGKVSKVDLGTL